MRCLALLVIISMICAEKFQTSVCLDDADNFEKEVVKDFVEYLKQKLEEKPHRNSRVKLSAENSWGEKKKEADYSDGRKKRNYEKNSERDDPNDNLQNSGESSSSKETPLSSKTVSSAEEEESVEQPGGVEEIVYFRRSESDSMNDPIPEIIEKLIHDPPIRNIRKRPRVVKRHAAAYASASLSAAADDANPSSSDEACPVADFASHIDHTCAEYEMEFHPAFSETLRHRMENMLPETNHEDSKCDFRRLLGPRTGVEDRALCPFERNISGRNPSRMPEYLYEAKCSCQVWIESSGKHLNCVEVKRTIPVLWLVSCGDGKKRYRQGWDEIAVACAPVEERRSASVDEGSSFD